MTARTQGLIQNKFVKILTLSA